MSSFKTKVTRVLSGEITLRQILNRTIFSIWPLRRFQFAPARKRIASVHSPVLGVAFVTGGRHDVKRLEELYLATQKSFEREFNELRNFFLKSAEGDEQQFYHYYTQNRALFMETCRAQDRQILQAIDETGSSGRWAALYLILGYRRLVSAKIHNHLNPSSDVVRPSAFVYAMY